MTSTSELISGLQTQVNGLKSRLAGLSPNPLIYAALGDAILYGCKVTEGSDSADYALLLDGEASGDGAFLNPDVSATPQYPFQFPNIATIKSGAFYIGNTLTVTVDSPPTTGTARYDIIYIFLGESGPGIGVATGTPSAAVKTDFDSNGLDTAPYGSGAITDPAIPVGSTAVARVYVEDVYTGIQNARIADLRQKLQIDAIGLAILNGTIDNTVIGGTTPAAVSGTTGDFSGDLTVDGDVGIGTTPTFNLHVQSDGSASDTSIQLTNSGTGSSNDTILRNSIGGTSASNFIFFGDGDDANVGQIRYQHSTDRMTFDTGAATRLTLDSSGLSLDGGSNYLDTYEEGTFTPVLRFGGATTGITYSTQVGRYTRIGNRVFIDLIFTLTSKGTATGVAAIGGLPYTHSNNTTQSISNFYPVSQPSFADTPIAQIAANSNSIALAEASLAGTATSIDDTNFDNNSSVRLSMVYEAA